MKLINRIDGRTKLITWILLTLLMFNFHYYFQYLVMIILLGLTVFTELNSSERGQIFRHWKLILILPILNLLINLFFVNGPVIWRWGWLKLTNLDLQIFIRLIILLILALGLIVITSPEEMALAVGKIAHDITLGHYNGLGIPLVIIIMSSFINEFQETFRSVRYAYTLRNSKTDSSYLKRAMNYIFMLQPVILIALRKADRVSDALIAKGYHRGARLFNYQEIKYHRRDYLIYLGLFIFILFNQLKFTF